MMYILSWFAGLTVFFLIQSVPYSDWNREQSFLAPPPEHIEHMTFGYQDLVADSLWLRLLQDFGVCQVYEGVDSEASTSIPLEVETENLHITNPRNQVCDNSWAYKMLDAITKLAPRFRMAYVAGGTALSILVEDYEGASIIYDRGLKQFPTDWSLAYRAAYHFLYDKKDFNRAAELLVLAEKNGAPDWLKALASRLYTETGQLLLALSLLESYRESVTHPDRLAQIDKRIAKLQEQLKRSNSKR